MEIRSNVKFIVLSIYQDELAKICYLKILTENAVESVKIPAAKEKNVFWHLLEFRNLLTGNFVKTRKNWILKEIVNFTTFILPKSYLEYENVAKMQIICNKLLKDGVDTKILPFLLTESAMFELEKADFYNFEHKLLAFLGFAKNPSVNTEQDKKNRFQAISDNHLNN